MPVTWQFVAWLLFFFASHQLFVAIFLAFISTYSTATCVLMTLSWITLWMLAAQSLVMATLRPFDEVPGAFRLPYDMDSWDPGFYEKVTTLLEERGVLPLVAKRNEIVNDTVVGPVPTVCPRCRVAKPLRCHHCSRCDRCLLRMDHHCPILGVCVYIGNHKFFLVFLFWATVLGAFAATAMMPHLRSRIESAYIALGAILPPSFPAVVAGSIAIAVYEILVDEGYGTWTILFASFATVITYMVPVLLGLLFGSLLLDVGRNRTTIERVGSGESCFFRRMVTAYWPDRQRSAYHLGSFRANFETIFGANPLLWLLPVPSTPSDGIPYASARFVMP